ncbi:kelch repeat protein [Teladorsagia circumcincta]|uniref:Kelch repeat protein n=1 Tax=Teladorsagia circumcincta TaxID=45464 RepID=A0A2G9U535_TELCI|nr:kelch repeat protein [Teladorsagia circumcincta]
MLTPPAESLSMKQRLNHLLLQLSTLERSKLHGPRIRPRKVLFGEVLYAVGGWSEEQGYNSVERLDPGEANPVWQAVAPMAKQRGGVVVSVIDNMLYAVGGRDGNNYLDFNERYDPSTNRWLCNLAPTCSARDSFGLVALDGSLYAVGGRYHDSSLNVVERYDIRRNEWIYVAPMATRRHGVSVSVLNGCLYAVGGADGKSILNTVERLDPRVGNWESVSPMSTCRHHEGSAVLDGYLYVAGGHDGSSPLNSAEKYNPISNEWSEVAAMNSKRHGVSLHSVFRVVHYLYLKGVNCCLKVRLAVVNGKVYAVGGEDDTTILNSVEVFDQETNQWTQHSCMKEPRFEAGLGVIRML